MRASASVTLITLLMLTIGAVSDDVILQSTKPMQEAERDKRSKEIHIKSYDDSVPGSSSGRAAQSKPPSRSCVGHENCVGGGDADNAEEEEAVKRAGCGGGAGNLLQVIDQILADANALKASIDAKKPMKPSKNRCKFKMPKCPKDIKAKQPKIKKLTQQRLNKLTKDFKCSCPPCGCPCGCPCGGNTRVTDTSSRCGLPGDKCQRRERRLGHHHEAVGRIRGGEVHEGGQLPRDLPGVAHSPRQGHRDRSHHLDCAVSDDVILQSTKPMQEAERDKRSKEIHIKSYDDSVPGSSPGRAAQSKPPPRSCVGHENCVQSCVKPVPITTRPAVHQDRINTVREDKRSQSSSTKLESRGSRSVSTRRRSRSREGGDLKAAVRRQRPSRVDPDCSQGGGDADNAEEEAVKRAGCGCCPNLLPVVNQILACATVLQANVDGKKLKKPKMNRCKIPKCCKEKIWSKPPKVKKLSKHRLHKLTKGYKTCSPPCGCNPCPCELNTYLLDRCGACGLPDPSKKSTFRITKQKKCKNCGGRKSSHCSCSFLGCGCSALGGGRCKDRCKGDKVCQLESQQLVQNKIQIEQQNLLQGQQTDQMELRKLIGRMQDSLDCMLAATTTVCPPDCYPPPQDVIEPWEPSPGARFNLVDTSTPVTLVLNVMKGEGGGTCAKKRGGAGPQRADMS